MHAHAQTADWRIRIDAARSHCAAAGHDTLPLDENALIRSWQRCHAIGLGLSGPVTLRTQAPDGALHPGDRNVLLRKTVSAVAERLAASVDAAGAVVVATNAAGTVIHASGDAAHLPPPWRQLMQRGTSLAEHHVGTTAPTLAVFERHPQIVIRDAHYCRSLQSFYCAAVPIHDPAGGLVGAIDISAYDRIPQVDVLGLLNVAADRIEDELLHGLAEAGVLQLVPPVAVGFAARPGLVAVDRRGWACALNRVARGWLGRQASTVLPLPLTQLLGSAVGHVERGPCRQIRSAIDLSLPSGLAVIASYHCNDGRDGHPGASST